jgi:hypothetical protein
MMPRTEASSCSNHEEKWSGSDKDCIPGFDGYGQAAESRTEAKMHGTEIGNVHFSFGRALTGARVVNIWLKNTLHIGFCLPLWYTIRVDNSHVSRRRNLVFEAPLRYLASKTLSGEEDKK